MIIGKEYSGFVLVNKEELPDIQAVGMEFEHLATKARVVALKNTDPNKLFGICFRTAPENSTGVPHILEHAVLSGTKKYPLKELFGELIKSGLRTFLNAMTFADRTCYPFSSKNTKEYFQTMDVYLDVVFNPLLAANTFKREGWHLDVAPDHNLVINGIVFNEMKGAFSDPQTRLIRHAYANLLPGSSYAFDSGGIPHCIPELTYEQFKDFYQANYHPSNAVAVVYGDADLEEELATINTYFSHYKYKSTFSKIAPGVVNSPLRFFRAEYPVSSTETLQEKTWHAALTKVGSPLDARLSVASRLLAAILYDSKASPLKKDLLKAVICKEMYGDFDADHACHSLFTTIIKASEPEHAQKFFDVYTQSLANIVKNGLDRDLIESEVAAFFTYQKIKNAKALRGLRYMFSVFSAFTYNNPDIFTELKQNELFKEIAKEAIDKRLLENLIEKHLLGNQETIVQSLVPSHTIQAEEEQLFVKQTEALKSKLTEKEISNIEAEAKALHAEMETPNSQEAIALLPKITMQDIDTNQKFVEAQAHKLEGALVLTSELFTNDLILLQVGLDVSCLTEEELPSLMPLANLICELGTPSQSSDTVAKELAKFTYGLSPSFRVITNKTDRTKVSPVLWFTAQILPENLEKALKLLQDVLLSPNFENGEKIKEILEREYANFQSEISSQGFIARYSMAAHLSKAGKYSELIHGYTAYQKLHALKELCKSTSAQITEFRNIHKKLLGKNNLILNIGAQASILSAITPHLHEFVRSFPQGDTNSQDIKPLPHNKNIAFLNNADVTFTGMGMDLAKHCNTREAVNAVVVNLLDTNYLYNKIRILGGAYGVQVVFDRNAGHLLLISYRDPNVAKTYAAYYECAKFLQDLTMSDEELEQLLISTFGNATPLLDPLGEITRAANYHLSGACAEDTHAFLKGILTVTVADIKQHGKIIEEALRSVNKSAAGNRHKLTADKHIFDELIELE